MKKTNGKLLCSALLCLLAFVVFTVAVCLVDVKAIGPEESLVGFATINDLFHKTVGLHLWLYDLTDLLSILPLGIVLGFALLGLYQWIKRKSLFRVDGDLLVLGGFYLAVLAAYLLFELLALNYRPVLIEGVLEASYPSSTTVLALCVTVTAAMQFHRRLKSAVLRLIVLPACGVFAAFMVIGRLLSGVHWLTDVIGGTLLCGGLILLYCFFCRLFEKKTT